MAQWRKITFGIIAVGGILFILAMGGLRGSRGSFTTPEVLKPNLAAISVGHVWAFAARAGTNVVLFDTGPDPDGQGLDALLKAVQAERKDVHDVFLTHCHGDHRAGVPLFTQARVWVGEGDVPQCAGTKGPETVMQRFLAWVNSAPEVMPSQKLDADAFMDVGIQQRVHAIPMPGHTLGSYAYVYDDVLFVGDAVSVDKGALVSVPGMFNPHPEAALKAMHALRESLGESPIDRVCAAHGGCTDSGSGNQVLRDFVAANPLQS